MLTEAQLASEVVAWLTSDNWDVYQEVPHPLGSDFGRADIVAVKDGVLAIVEAKRDLSFELLAQGRRWFGLANAIFIAVPIAKRTVGRDEAMHLARHHYGFGLLEVADVPVSMTDTFSTVKQRWEPRARERESDRLLDSLRPEHKTHAKAGSSGGGQYTPYRGTVEALSRYVAENDGCKLGDALEAIQHHYRSKASAISSLSKWIKKGKVPGVYLGSRQRLYSNPAASKVFQREAA